MFFDYCDYKTFGVKRYVIRCAKHCVVVSEISTPFIKTLKEEATAANSLKM